MEIEHYKKYIDACNEEIIEMKHLNETVNFKLSETKERVGQLIDEKASIEERLNKGKLNMDSAMEEIEALQTWKSEAESELGDVRKNRYQYEKEFSSRLESMGE